MMLTDSELLAAYVANRDQDALCVLLQRHLGMVYAAAIRQVRDPGMAEDIVQGVFMALVSKAPSLHAKAATLPAWLLVTTRYAACNELRRRSRFKRHEQKGAVMETTLPPAVDSEKLSSMLDEALNRLSPADRTAIALYYFENHSLRDVGHALAVSEDAAQMRLSRALVRLRSVLQRAGITCPADALEESLHRCGAVTAPAALLAAVTNSLLHPAAASPGGALVAQHILQGLLIKKVATMAIAAAIALAVATPAVKLAYLAYSAGPKMTATSSVNTPTAANTLAASSAPSSFTTTLPNGISVELVGLMDDSTHQSWAADGSLLQNPLQTTGQGYVNLHTNPNVIQRGIIWSARLKFPPMLDVDYSGSLNVGNGGVTSESSGHNGAMITQLTPVPESQTIGTINLEFATGHWKTIVASDGSQTVDGGEAGIGDFTLEPAVNDGNNLTIMLIQKNLQEGFYDNYTSQLVARTNNGKLIYPDSSSGNGNQTTYSFNNVNHQIKTIDFDIKRYDMFAEFQNVSLVPNKRTNVQINAWQNIN
jgi:RNA polymerase sigma factor (sigma-70 family)